MTDLTIAFCYEWHCLTTKLFDYFSYIPSYLFERQLDIALSLLLFDKVYQATTVVSDTVFRFLIVVAYALLAAAGVFISGYFFFFLWKRRFP